MNDKNTIYTPVIPSIYAIKSFEYESNSRKINDSKCEYIHIDVMDGNYVPNISFGTKAIKRFIEETKKKVDIHIMVEDVGKVIDELIDLDISRIAIHYDKFIDNLNIVKKIKSKNIDLGLVLLANKKYDGIDLILPFIDYFLVMSSTPGTNDSKFIPETYKFVSDLSLIYSLPITVDGKLTVDIVPKILKAGANMVVMGGALFEGDFNYTMNQLEVLLNG